MKQILVVSHCILNTSSKVTTYDPTELEAEERNRKLLLAKVIDQGYELLQLPCPELMMFGTNRWGHTREQFDNPFYRQQAKNLLQPIIDQLLAYQAQPDRFNLRAVISVDGSPSCGYRRSCSAQWGGEFSGRQDLDQVLESITLADQPGIFMSVLEELLESHQVAIPFVDLSQIDQL